MLVIKNSFAMSFPSLVQHYVDLLYGAYKSSDPSEYLREFLQPYADTLTPTHVRYLHKLLYNRDKLAKDEVVRLIEQEENGVSKGYPLSRFLFFSTALCHIWYRPIETPFLYPLDPVDSTIVCYQELNVPVPYIWFNVNVGTGTLDLVKWNVTHLQALTVTTIWKWVDEHDDKEPVTQRHSYDLYNGQRFTDISPTMHGNAYIIRVAVSGVDGRVGVTCELGIEHEWPFALLLTYSVLNHAYILNKLLYNSPTGHLLPLLCAMHPLT